MWTRLLSLLWNIPLHCVDICRCDWFNKKKDDWPIVREDEVRQENQTKETRKKKGGI